MDSQRENRPGQGQRLAAVPVSVTEATREGPGTKVRVPAERVNMVGPVRDRAPDGPTVPVGGGQSGREGDRGQEDDRVGQGGQRDR